METILPTLSNCAEVKKSWYSLVSLFLLIQTILNSIFMDYIFLSFTLVFCKVMTCIGQKILHLNVSFTSTTKSYNSVIFNVLHCYIFKSYHCKQMWKSLKCWPQCSHVNWHRLRLEILPKVKGKHLWDRAWWTIILILHVQHCRQAWFMNACCCFNDKTS